MPGSSDGAERYQMLEVLGKGAMGEVRKAYDPHLGRHVALKILRDASPELAQRLAHEARAQARVEHPNVCKVYGVGELDGQPFIALQLVDGKTLRDTGPSMTRDALVRVVRDVAEALHAAHRQGLIHRDVKPANVLVEKTEAGTYHPYVTDFGLAREIAAPGATALGVAVGTPLYMAPEQARGSTAKLDRRTDVYGLGATLYELLAGRPPFPGDHSIDVLVKVLYEDPASLRTIDPTIPADLETIVEKAMHKNPAHRYDSARALAEDLQRYLDGDPIQARPQGLAYRIIKRARKHRGVVIASAAAVVASVLFGGYAIHQRSVAATEAQLAQQFGQEAERIAAISRDAVLLPLHDPRPEMEEIRQRMAGVSARMQALGPVAAGPGHYALGRGYLALERWSDAVRDLEAAYVTGFRSPELAYALGLSHGKLYQKKLAALVRTADAAFDAAQREKLVHAHRDPALRYLKEVGARERDPNTRASAPEYHVEAMIALYEQRWDDALDLARRAAASSPLWFEARTLEGDIQLTLGQERYMRGDGEQALEALRRAGAAYRAAAELARSSGAALAGECWRLLEESQILVDKDLAPDVKSVLAACNVARTARPDDAALIAAQAKAWAELAWYQAFHSTDPTDAAAQSIQLGEQTLELEAKEQRAYHALASSYYILGYHRGIHGGDALTALDRAIGYARHALEVDPAALWAYHRISSSYWTKGERQAARGADPRPSFAAAIEYAQTEQLKLPGSFDGWADLAASHDALALWQIEHGVDPTAALDRAAVAYRRAASSSTLALPLTNLCATLGNAAGYLARIGQDPTAKLEESITACEQAIAIDENDSFSHADLGAAYIGIALWLLEHDGDPTEKLAQARTEFTRAQAIDPTGEGYRRQGECELTAARWAARRRRDPERAFAAADAAIRRALGLSAGKDADALRGLAEIERWRAGWLLESGRSAGAAVREGLELIARAVALKPDFADAWATQGALQLIASRATHLASERAAAAGQARASFEKALSMNAFLSHEVGPLLEQAKRLAP
jgi:serine/threonine-protein kinase